MYRLFPVLLILLLSTLITAQEEQPAPQFLYRDDNRLILLDGYTGETTELSIEVGEDDIFYWLPNGKYLVALFAEGNKFQYCLNLYNVDNLTWLHDKPVACEINSVRFSADSKQIVYVAPENYNETLWRYNIEDEVKEILYRTTDGNKTNPMSIVNVVWSPTQKYLTFTPYADSSSEEGADYSFVVMDFDTQDYFTVEAPDLYNASYLPVWSKDDEWFLLDLREDYRRYMLPPFPNHHGDVYLFNSKTGGGHRLTYTPSVDEINIHWTEEGNIAFSEAIYKAYEFTLEEAMNIEPVPDEDIVILEVQGRETPYRTDGIEVSPDPRIGAWVDTRALEEGIYTHTITVGSAYATPPVAHFRVTVETSHYHIDIGWRPSDYPYEQQE
jgi:hypothetical protein